MAAACHIELPAARLECSRRREAWLAQRLRSLDPADREVLVRAAEVLDRLASE